MENKIINVSDITYMSELIPSYHQQIISNEGSLAILINAKGYSGLIRANNLRCTLCSP